MKQIIANILQLLVVCCTGCTPTAPYPLAMQQAENCMNTRPDSALYLLQTLEDSLSSFPEETRMYYHLLCIQAKDKEYINHTDDSLINRIVDFYENRNEANKLMMAYYYQGSVYRDMNDAPRALKAFQQAVDISTPDNDLLPKAYNQMGSLFMYQGLYDEAIKVNRKNIELYTKSGKPNKASFALRDIARMYNAKGFQDSTLIYYEAAYHKALSDSDFTRYYDILGEYGGFNYKIGNTEKAKISLLIAEKNLYTPNKHHIYLRLGNIYSDAKQWDSAYYFFNKTLKGEDLYSKYYAYKDLSKIEFSQNNPTKAFEYLTKHTVLKDSIDYITQTEAIAKINSLYNYQHTEKKNALLELNEAKNKITILILLLILSAILVISISFISLQKKKSREIVEQTKKIKEIEKRKYQKSLTAFFENNKKMTELDQLLKDAQKKNNQLKQELILTQKEILSLRNKEIVASNNEQELRIATFQQTSAYLLLQRAASDSSIKITDKDWEQISLHLNLTYPEFTEHLYQLYPQLSTIEIRICWLVKLSFSPAEISRLLLRTKPAISNARVRLYKKIHKTDGSGEMFDNFIRRL